MDRVLPHKCAQRRADSARDRARACIHARNAYAVQSRMSAMGSADVLHGQTTSQTRVNSSGTDAGRRFTGNRPEHPPDSAMSWWNTGKKPRNCQTLFWAQLRGDPSHYHARACPVRETVQLVDEVRRMLACNDRHSLRTAAGYSSVAHHSHRTHSAAPHHSTEHAAVRGPHASSTDRAVTVDASRYATRDTSVGNTLADCRYRSSWGPIRPPNLLSEVMCGLLHVVVRQARNARLHNL